jgi:hypothetical protein
MILEEYDEAAVMAAMREEAREEGREEVNREFCGKIATLVASGKLSLDDAAEVLDCGLLEAALQEILSQA